MANIKQKFEQLTGWIEYKLESNILDPPILKLRLRPLYEFSKILPEDYGHSGQVIAENVFEVVAEWDLTDNGERIPLTEDNKVRYLAPLLQEKLKDQSITRSLLGLAIYEDAQNRALFLKN
jgi:hypothetical protein